MGHLHHRLDQGTVAGGGFGVRHWSPKHRVAITPATNFTVGEYFLRRRGKRVSGRVQLNYTGPAIEADSLGNFTNITAFTVPDAWRPDWYGRIVPWALHGITDLYGYINNTGVVNLTHSAVQSTTVVPSGTTLRAFLDYEIG